MHHHSSCADGPCRVPPHPDLLAQFRAESKQGTNQAPLQNQKNTGFSAPTGTIPGLNDGAIFNESHFAGTPSPSQMARAALERAPLRGSIRFVDPCSIIISV